MSKVYEISMKGKKYLYSGEDRFDANRRLFKDITDGKISLKDVSLIMITQDGDDEYPMRLVPSLYAMGQLSLEGAMETLAQVGLHLTYEEFMETVDKDNWLWAER